MLVVDASAVLELLLATPAGAAVAERIGDESLHAPELLGVEVVSVLNRMTRAGRMTSADALDLLAVLAALDVQTYPHDVLLARIHQLRTNLTAYDAAYVALAEAMGAVLITCDTKLARAPGHRARCELVG